MQLPAYLLRIGRQVEEMLAHLLPAEETAPATIHRAMRYSALSGGKRLRAMLAVEAARLRSGDGRSALPYAAAIEMIHAYSLIHDDLPCMDDDDYRRGKLTNHKVFGEGIAVLAGDALLTEAFIVLGRLPQLSGVSAELALQIVAEVATAAGTMGLIGGQVADLEAEGKALAADAAEVLRFIHSRKTGALFRASLRGGALIGGLMGDDLAHVSRYAECFGLAFQITDDILDVVGDSAALGKSTGSDARKEKLTYPRVFGLERSRAMAQEALAEAQASLAPFGERAEGLRQLAAYCTQRDH
jgi:geranylgeranyl diphosphate synthase type II